MTDFTKRSDYEARTHELLAKVYQGEEGEGRANEVLVANVFKAMWSASLPVEKVERVACAMYGFEKLDLQAALTSLAKARVLRSRMSGGQRFYEVNY